MIMIIPVNLSFLLCKLGASISNKAIKTIIVRARSMRCDLVQGGGGGFQKNWMGGCGTARFLKPLPYFRPKSVIFPSLFQTCIMISSLGQTNVKGNVYTLLLIRIQNGTISFELKLIPHYKAGCIMRRHKYRIRAYLTLI